MKSKKIVGSEADIDKNFEKTVFKTALENGCFIPTTISEVEIMEKILEREDLPCEIEIPNVQDVLNRTTENTELKMEKSENNYAMAARKNTGQSLSEETRSKMEQLKKKSK